MGVIFLRLAETLPDPIAPLLFSIVLQDIVEAIEVPGLEVNAWFLDDGVQVGTAEQVVRIMEIMEIMKREGPSRGLILNTLDNTPNKPSCKTTVWRKDFCERGEGEEEEMAMNFMDSGARTVTEEGTILLGAPLGSVEYVREASKSRIKKMEDIAEKLVFMEDAQSEYVLLRSCLSTPKMMFALRTVDPQLCEDLWEEVDDITRQSLQRILGVMPTDIQWQQSQLPVSMGGLGLRSARMHSFVAYALLYAGAESIHNDLRNKEWGCPLSPLSRSYIQRLQSLVGRENVENPITMEELGNTAQKTWSSEVDLRNQAAFQTRIREQGSSRDIIRTTSRSATRSSSHRSSSGWGSPSTGRRANAHHLRDILSALATAAHLNPRQEEQNLIPGSGRRPADIMVPQWLGGKDVAYDVTVINNFRQDLANKQLGDTRHALEKAKKTKNSLLGRLQEGGHHFHTSTGRGDRCVGGQGRKGGGQDRQGPGQTARTGGSPSQEPHVQEAVSCFEQGKHSHLAI